VPLYYKTAFHFCRTELPGFFFLQSVPFFFLLQSVMVIMLKLLIIIIN